MKNNFFTNSRLAATAISILLMGSGMACTGQVNPPVKKNTLPKAEAHIYGPYKLERNQDIYTADVVKDSVAFRIEERYPGVLIHKRKLDEALNRWGNTVLIEFYDTTTHILKKQIDLEAITPYNDRLFRNISIGGLDYEYMEMYGPDTNCQMVSLPKPTYYYTRNSIFSVSDKGEISVTFELLRMARPNNVVGWEQTLLILDRQGGEIFRKLLKYEISTPIISKDGQLLTYSYNRSHFSTPEPFDPCEAAVDIYDLKENKLLVHYRGGTTDLCGNPVEKEDLIYYRFFNEKTQISKQIIIDTEQRSILIYQFKWSERLLPPWEEYLEFLKKQPVSQLKF